MLPRAGYQEKKKTGKLGIRRNKLRLLRQMGGGKDFMIRKAKLPG